MAAVCKFIDVNLEEFGRMDFFGRLVDVESGLWKWRTVWRGRQA